MKLSEISDSRTFVNFEVLKNFGATLAYEEASPVLKKVKSESDLLGNLVKKDTKEITIENTIGPNQDVIKITYRRGMTAGDILLELDMVNNYLLADVEGELSLEDVIPPSTELFLVPGSIAGAKYHLQERKQLLNDLVSIFHLSIDKISRFLYKDENILEDVLINYKKITKEKQAFLINELMYNIYMIDPHNSYIFRFYSDLGNLREIQIKALEKCYDFLIKEGYDAENIGFSQSEIIHPHLFDTLERIIKEESGDMLPRKHSDYEVRIEWYKPRDERIEQIVAKYFKIPLKDNSYQKARLTFHLRNLFKMKARIFMGDQRNALNLMKYQYIRTWNQVYQKSADKVEKRLNQIILETGKTEIEILNELGFNSREEMIHREIIDGAQRTNKVVTDYLLGIKKLT